MNETPPDILILEHQKIEPAELARLVSLFFDDMVKYVADIAQRRAGVGGGLHAALIGQGEPLP